MNYQQLLAILNTVGANIGRLQNSVENPEEAAAESNAANQRSVAAGMLAALMENKDPETVMEKATKRFHGSSFDPVWSAAGKQAELSRARSLYRRRFVLLLCTKMYDC